MAQKPGRVITQDAFLVAPHLVGLPLASASRRAVAMMVDLVLVAILVNVGGAVLFGLVAAYVFFRVSSGRAGSRVSPRVRGVLRTAGTLALFVMSLNLWNSMAGDADEDAGVRSTASAGERTRVTAQASGGPGAMKAILGSASMLHATDELEETRDLDEARTAARRVRRSLTGMGLPRDEVAEVMLGMVDEAKKPHVAQALREAAGPAAVAAASAAGRDSSRALAPDSLALAYAAAFRARDTSGAAALGPRLAAAVAADTLEKLGSEVKRLNGEVGALQEAAAEREAAAEEVGLLSMLRHVADDLGLGFGWTGLYFTAFLALWKGQTPGKRMAGVRVMRLNGAPMTIWTSFERFGGYAASIFTGLLGFFQILWDRNRQGIHDKIVETVVVRIVPGLDPAASTPAGRYDARPPAAEPAGS